MSVWKHHSLVIHFRRYTNCSWALQWKQQRRWGSNPQPCNHESNALTTAPRWPLTATGSRQTSCLWMCFCAPLNIFCCCFPWKRVVNYPFETPIISFYWFTCPWCTVISNTCCWSFGFVLVVFVCPRHGSWWTVISILYIKTEFAKVCSGLGIFKVANTPRILTVLVP